MQKKKSILLGLSLALVMTIVAGCGSDHKNSSVKEGGADVSIERFGGVGSPLKQKVTIKEGEVLAIHLDVKNIGNEEAENVQFSCTMRKMPEDNSTLTLKREISGVMSPSELYKKNIYIDGTAALDPGDYNLGCETLTTSQDVNKKNNRRVITVTIKGDSN